jgi:hypothetical protein
MDDLKRDKTRKPQSRYRSSPELQYGPKFWIVVVGFVLFGVLAGGWGELRGDLSPLWAAPLWLAFLTFGLIWQFKFRRNKPANQS